MSSLVAIGISLVTAVCLVIALWLLAELVAWPGPAGRVIAGYIPGRWRAVHAGRSFLPADLTIRTRCIAVADLVALRPTGEEVIVSGRTPEDAAALYRELTGEAWTCETAARKSTRTSA